MLLRNEIQPIVDEIVSSSYTESQGKVCHSPGFNPRILRYVVSEDRQIKQCCTLALENVNCILTFRMKSPYRIL
jgi:hypothetical protein